MEAGEVLQQGRGVTVGLQEPLEHPAHRKLQAQVLQGRTHKEVLDGLKAAGRTEVAGAEGHNQGPVFVLC